jgi:hypothetical protein
MQILGKTNGIKYAFQLAGCSTWVDLPHLKKPWSRLALFAGS